MIPERAWRSGSSALAMVAAFALGMAVVGLQPASQAEDDAHFKPLREAFALAQDNYIREVPADLLIEGALTGMLAALEDEFSYYIPPDKYAREYDYSGEFTGIGVMVETTDSGEIVVVEVIADSPADGVGALEGDIFHAVDGVSVAGFTQEDLSEVVPGPRGTNVQITFQRGADLLTFDITRDVFVVPNVEHEVIGENIAYISMKDFHALSRGQLEEAFAAVDIHARAGMILDVRGNPGGTIESAFAVASLFIEDGVILQEVNRHGEITTTEASGDSAGIEIPIALLVDGVSASASEVLAGALQDYGRAVVIGETTFGKGTVQTLQEISNGGAVRLTARRFLTPNRREIDGVGIVPDIMIEQSEGEADSQLAAAIQFLSKDSS